jgi:hypothetical protein
LAHAKSRGGIKQCGKQQKDADTAAGCRRIIMATKKAGDFPD